MSSSSAASSSTGGTTDDHRRRRRLEDLIERTMENLDACDPGQLRNIAQLAAIVARDDDGGGRRRRRGDHPLVRGEPARRFWDGMTGRVASGIDAYRPKWLVSVAWALATVSSLQDAGGDAAGPRRDGAREDHRVTVDASPLFRAVRSTFARRRSEFTSKHMGNLAWSCATCRRVVAEGGVDGDGADGGGGVPRRHPLMLDLSNEFVRRRRTREEEERKRLRMLGRGGVGSSSGGGDVAVSVAGRDVVDFDDDSLDPMALCQWANSYAKAGHDDGDEDLFREISAAAIPMLGRFDSRHCSNLAHAFALAGHASAALFDEIAAAAIPRMPTFTSQNMANISWAYAKANHASPILFDAIAGEATTTRMGEFSAQQLANVAWAYSKFPPTTASDAIFDRVAREVASRGGLDSFTMQGVAMLAHSFASAGRRVERSGDFWDAVDRAVTSRPAELGAIESSQIAWSFATIGRCPSDGLLRGIEAYVSSNAKRIRPQGLSNLAWSFAMLGYASPAFFRVVAEESLRRLDDFAPEDEVMLVLAYSRTSHAFPELLDRIAPRSLSHLSEFSGLDLFNMVVSYVRAGRQSRHWMEAIASEIIRRPSAFSPQVIVGITWAYASAGCRIQALLNFLSDECIDCCDELKSKEVASLAWSFASLDCYHRPILGALADSSDGRWSEFDASSLANMAWAYATAQEDRPRLFEGIANAAKDRGDEFTPQGVSMLLWSCAAAGHLDRRLFLSMEPTAASFLRECDSQSLANIAWAYAVADLDADSLFGPESHFVSVLVEMQDKFDRRGLCQLHQWNEWRKEIANNSALPAHFEKRCYDEFTNQPLHVSNLQKDVISELASMGIPLKEEVRTRSGYSLDAVVLVNGKNIGLEVDGPHHFVGKQPTGSTILKHRQVAAIDRISLVSLPYWELNDLKQSADKQQYLRTKLGLDRNVIIHA
jgi:hypothetical protein